MNATARILYAGTLLLTTLSIVGCSHPGILYPNERPVDADFGSLDSAELVSQGFALYGRKYPEATRIRWFVPVAHIRSTRPSPLIPTPLGWELVVLLGRVDVVPSATTLTSFARAGNYLCLAYFIRPGIDDTTAAWATESDSVRIEPMLVYDSPLSIDDVSFYIEKIVQRLDGGRDCVWMEPERLANWDALFESRPYFAYPVCNVPE